MNPSTSAPPSPPDDIASAAARAAEKRAAAVEHQRLSAAVQAPGISYNLLPAWQEVITLAREVWGRHQHPQPYSDHVRFLAYRDAADAIARKAIGEA